MSRELRRINVNMPEELVARIDEYAEKMFINRTSAVNILISMSLDGYKAMNTMEEMMKVMRETKVNAIDYK